MLVKTGYESVGTTPDQYLSMRAEDANKMASLLIQKYKSRVTPIREIVINALETTDNAVKEGREFQPVEINFDMEQRSEVSTSPFTTPDDLLGSPEDGGTITITDHGEGMSQEFVETVFSYLGASTKDQDSAAVGGFGIGSKSVLSMTDYATWRTVRDGVATVIAMSRDGDGFTINTSSTPTEDENGTVVKIPVTGEVMSYVVDHIHGEFLDYIPKDRVIVRRGGMEWYSGEVVDNVVFTATNGVQFTQLDEDGEPHHHHLYDRTGKVHVLVNGYPYPTPEIFGSGYGGDREFLSQITRDIFTKLGSGNVSGLSISLGDIIVQLDQNDPDVVSLGAREALVDSDSLRERILDIIKHAIQEMVVHYYTKFVAATTVEEWIPAAWEFYEDNALNIDFDYSSSDLRSMVGSLLDTEVGAKEIIRSWHTRTIFFVVDATEGSYVPFSRVKKDGCTTIMEESKVKLTQHTCLEDFEWKSKLNYCIRVSGSKNALNMMLEAESIDDVLPERLHVRYIMCDWIRESNEYLFQRMERLGILPEQQTLDDFYRFFGIAPLDEGVEEVRAEVLSRARKWSRDNGTHGEKRKGKKSTTSIHVHHEGEDSFTTISNHTLKEIDSTLRELVNRSTTKKVKTIYVCSTYSKRNGLLSTMLGKNAAELREMMRSVDFDTFIVVEATVEDMQRHASYFTRVTNIVTSSLEPAFILHMRDMPQQDNTQWIPDPYQNILAQWENFFSAENVASRGKCSQLALKHDRSISVVAHDVDTVSRMYYMDGSGNPILPELVGRYGGSSYIQDILSSFAFEKVPTVSILNMCNMLQRGNSSSLLERELVYADSMNSDFRVLLGVYSALNHYYRITEGENPRWEASRVLDGVQNLLAVMVS